jgi:putative phosphoribosyl transferase
MTSHSRAGSVKTPEEVWEIVVPISPEGSIAGSLAIPRPTRGLVLFAHGSGSSRFSPRNRFVSDYLGEAGLATLLVDLLTEAEERVDVRTAEFRFDIELLASRLVGATAYCREIEDLEGLSVGYFGASTGAAATLIAAADSPVQIDAVVSRGGRPDLAERALRLVRAPTLLIVGGDDDVVIELNRKALASLSAPKALEIVPGATHLFEEPGKLERVAELSRDWFLLHLKARQP